MGNLTSNPLAAFLLWRYAVGEAVSIKSVTVINVALEIEGLHLCHISIDAET